MQKIVAATTVYALLGLMMLGILGVAVWVSADDCIHMYMCGPTYDTCCAKGCTYESWEDWGDADSWYEMIGLGGIKSCCYYYVINAIEVECPTPPHLCTDAKYEMAIGPCPPQE